MAEAATKSIHDERLAFTLPELTADIELRRKAANFIGAVATGAWHESQSATARETDEALSVRPIESLYDAIQAAAEGDEMGRRMVEANVSSDVIERTLKAGHIREIDQMVDEAGTIHQYGQSMESVQANSLRFASDNPKMRARSEAETRNSFRIKYCYDMQLLKEYYLVVASRAADNMTKREMQSAGFFTDTMSCAFQVTSEQDNRLITEAAFVAGVKQPGANRHDGNAVETMLSRLGVTIANLSATELLDTPILVHKSLLPDGALTLVEMYDDAAGGSFFGQDKPRQDYQAYRQKCTEREQGFQHAVGRIVRALIAEVATITGPAMATERLHKLSGKHMIELAGKDVTINPDVFGPASAARIEIARWHMEKGNIEQAQLALREAVKHDRSTSCPTGKIEPMEGLESDGPSQEADGKDNEDADCDFISKQCPECGAKNVKTKVRKISGKKHISGDCGCTKVITGNY